jgi:hypothetical protein
MGCVRPWACHVANLAWHPRQVKPLSRADTCLSRLDGSGDSAVLQGSRSHCGERYT